MGIHLQLILTTCIVNFGSTYDHVQDFSHIVTNKIGDESDQIKIRENFQNLFQSIAKHDSKKSKTYREILKQKLAKEQETFDAMREELQMARSRNSDKKRKFFEKSSNHVDFVETKRDTRNKLPGQVSAPLGDSTYRDGEYEYEYVTLDYAIEAPNVTMMREPCQYLCRLPDEERIKICKEALEHEFAIKHGIRYLENGKLGEAKMYRLKVNDGHYVVDAPKIISACTCPTSPTIYLRNKFEGYDVQCHVVLPPDKTKIITTDIPDILTTTTTIRPEDDSLFKDFDF